MDIKLLSVFIILLTFKAKAASQFTVVKDDGHKNKEEVEVKKSCREVLKEESQKRSQVLTLKNAELLQVFRADGSFGWAAKCILQSSK